MPMSLSVGPSQAIASHGGPAHQFDSVSLTLTCDQSSQEPLGPEGPGRLLGNFLTFWAEGLL